MNNIVMIPVEQLHHHPENPRLDLGDLTELAESIKANGVMQNLTVVMKDGPVESYLVVIGNRRMEAAKLAGLEAVPCVISNMDHKTQISTMLMENMQRADLTPFEQAQGFQMMMDLGFTEKEIGEKTGFSEKTVKDRLKLTKLNKENFSEAVARGATLMDMLKISKLKSLRDQAEVMKEAGTNNFRQVLQRKLGEQKFSDSCEKLKKLMAQVGEGAYVLMPKGVHYWDSNVTRIDSVNSKDAEDKILRKLKKLNKENGQLCYHFNQDWNTNEATMNLYQLRMKKKEELTAEEQAKKDEEKARQKRSRYTRKLWAEAYQLRLDFVKNYTVTINGTSMTNIGKLIVRYSLGQKQKYGRDTLPENQHWKGKYIREALGIEPQEYEDRRSILELMEGRSDVPMIRAAIAWMMGGGVFDCDSPESGLYDYNEGTYCEGSYYGTMLKERYEFLKEIGYEMSDLETQLMDGTHPCYRGETE